MPQSDQSPSVEIVVDHSTVMRSRSYDAEPAIYALIDKDRAYFAPWIEWMREYTPEMLHQNVIETYRETAEGTLYLFDIFYEGTFVGAVDAHNVVAGSSAELGYWVGQDYIGKGLATTCTQALIDYLRTTYTITQFYAVIEDHNAASIRVAEKLGFKRDDTAPVEHEANEVVYSKTL